MSRKLIQQGAEAKIFLTENKSKKFIIKDRIKKSYRIPELDNKIRKSRTKKEAKLLTKASKIINSPEPFFIPDFLKIKMPFIEGEKLSSCLDKFPLNKQKDMAKQIGEIIKTLHENEIIHGDLTTSNMILGKDKKIYLIDFGLGFVSHKYEDRAMDLYLLKEALEAKHFKNYESLFKEIIREYKKLKTSKTVLERLKSIEKRRRYKH